MSVGRALDLPVYFGDAGAKRYTISQYEAGLPLNDESVLITEIIKFRPISALTLLI